MSKSSCVRLAAVTLKDTRKSYSLSYGYPLRGNITSTRELLVQFVEHISNHNVDFRLVIIRQIAVVRNDNGPEFVSTQLL